MEYTISGVHTGIVVIVYKKIMPEYEHICL